VTYHEGASLVSARDSALTKTDARWRQHRDSPKRCFLEGTCTAEERKWPLPPIFTHYLSFSLIFTHFCSFSAFLRENYPQINPTTAQLLRCSPPSQILLTAPADAHPAKTLPQSPQPPPLHLPPILIHIPNTNPHPRQSTADYTKNHEE